VPYAERPAFRSNRANRAAHRRTRSRRALIPERKDTANGQSEGRAFTAIPRENDIEHWSRSGRVAGRYRLVAACRTRSRAERPHRRKLPAVDTARRGAVSCRGRHAWRSGIDGKLRSWAARLVSWGYAALIVDSFRSRGLGNICDRVNAVSSDARAGDAIAAKAYLQSLPNIAKGRIGLIGFSHGGGAALAAASSFDAVVAFYPWCNGQVPANTLVLIGSADDWTPAARCSGDAANLKVYAGATHSFDRPDSRINVGHREIPDAAAAGDAASRTRQFLASHLGR
jgi:dienelactone hydrolase